MLILRNVRTLNQDQILAYYEELLLSEERGQLSYPAQIDRDLEYIRTLANSHTTLRDKLDQLDVVIAHRLLRRTKDNGAKN